MTSCYHVTRIRREYRSKCKINVDEILYDNENKFGKFGGCRDQEARVEREFVVRV